MNECLPGILVKCFLDITAESGAVWLTVFEERGSGGGGGVNDG